MDLPDSDWGDFSCRRAVDSSSLLCYPLITVDAATRVGYIIQQTVVMSGGVGLQS